MLTLTPDEHWEKIAFTELHDPEYTAGQSGRIEWVINNYQGTKEIPNNEVIMKSPVVNIGGLDWQIKLYPKGNDSDYLSIYVECLSLADDKCENDAPDAEGEQGKPRETPATIEREIERHLPLPTLNADTIATRPATAAQVAVVLYNPSEPRVNSNRTCLHRFCSRSPDWGWTRFHGPYYEIQNRQHGQRQALLRNDALAFTAYIRLVADSTNCLWEHTSHENPWDSFAMTGLRAMSLSDRAMSGSLISAVASWLMFRPFRNLLYQLILPDPEKEPLKRPAPLLTAFQKVLYQMRTGSYKDKHPVQLDEILYALLWYGIKLDVMKTNVMDVWDVLRIKVIEELGDEFLVTKFTDLFGSMQDMKASLPTFRIPVKGVNKLQDSINQSKIAARPNHQLPLMLSFELDRQKFDDSAKSYKKLVSKLSIDEHVTVSGTSYTLYGLIAHKEDLQSGRYYPLLRPEGPGSNWYKFSDGKHGYQVRCVPRSQAIAAHEGSSSGKETREVAYVVMYVRDDVVSDSISKSTTEPWNAPAWLIDEIEKESSFQAIPTGVVTKSPTTDEPADQKMSEQEIISKDEALEFHVIDSRAFLQHEGPGTIDTYNPKWHPETSELVSKISLNSKDSCKDIRQKLADSLQVDDPRQCKFWLIDSYRGMEGRPNLLSTGSVEISSGSLEISGDDWTLEDIRGLYPEFRIWVHVIEKKDLPLPPSPIKKSSMSDSSGLEPAADASQPTPEAAPSAEDTRMEGSDGQAEANSAEIVLIEETNDNTNTEATNEAVAELLSTSDGDATMEEAILASNPITPAPSSEQTPPNEIYFFLKVFDAESQKLSCHGSFIAKKSDRIDTVVRDLLSISSDKELEIYEEEDIRTANQLNSTSTFTKNDLHNTAVLIVHCPPSKEQMAQLTAQSAFLDPQKFLSSKALQRNFPHLSNGLFTLRQFGNEYYTGEMRNHYFHGQGTRNYFDGAIYKGSFALSRRHGHGYMRFPNGDTYDGEWSEDQQNGKGTFVESATGNTYVGGWRDGKRFGEGVTHWKVAHESERPCRICWEETADAAFYDCGHVVACLECARRVDTCPICRKRVLSSMRLYYAT